MFVGDVSEILHKARLPKISRICGQMQEFSFAATIMS